jgi:large subunit ribosomal protein L31
MKADTHPDYVQCQVTCGCGETFLTQATVPEMRVEVCSKCHPFYTGKQKLVDSTGRVERFQKRWGAHMDARKAAITGQPASQAESEEVEATQAEPAEDE